MNKRVMFSLAGAGIFIVLSVLIGAKIAFKEPSDLEFRHLSYDDQHDVLRDYVRQAQPQLPISRGDLHLVALSSNGLTLSQTFQYDNHIDDIGEFRRAIAISACGNKRIRALLDNGVIIEREYRSVNKLIPTMVRIEVEQCLKPRKGVQKS